jgi:hypothetical protein
MEMLVIEIFTVKILVVLDFCIESNTIYPLWMSSSPTVVLFKPCGKGL